MGARNAKKAAAPFKGDAHALLVMIYQDQTLPLAIRLDAAKAAIPFEKPELAVMSLTADEVDASSDAALREAVARWYGQVRRRDN